MKKKQPLLVTLFPVLALLVVLASLTACAITLPPDWEDDYRPIRVVLKVDPDDARVFLNGKWIGEAYEFSKSDSALKLATRNNEVILKHDGFVEESIDLRNFSSHNITLRVQLRPDRNYRESEPSRNERPESRSPEAPKTVPEKTPPPEPSDEAPSTAVKPAELSLTVSPDESSIYMNGKFWGISPESGKIENIRLKPGKYSLEIVKPGYKTYKKEWEFKAQTYNLSVHLEKESSDR
ncbi:MAG: PEGA domain-containing protein [Candidatus Omnitrophota bacterium]